MAQCRDLQREALARSPSNIARRARKFTSKGQLQTRKWQDQSGADRYTTEVVLQRFRGELQLLDSRGGGESERQRKDDLIEGLRIGLAVEAQRDLAGRLGDGSEPITGVDWRAAILQVVGDGGREPIVAAEDMVALIRHAIDGKLVGRRLIGERTPILAPPAAIFKLEALPCAADGPELVSAPRRRPISDEFSNFKAHLSRGS
jgi:hypothetical protein